MSKKYDEIENMMLDIVDFGKEITYNEIEEIIDPIKRFNKRHTFFLALDNIEFEEQNQEGGV